MNLLAQVAEQFVQDGSAGGGLPEARRVEALAQQSAPSALEQEVGMVGEVRLSPQHAMFLGTHPVIVADARVVSSEAVPIIQGT
jgi:hypothetical protein